MIRIRDSIRVPGRVRATWWLLFIQFLALMAAKSVGEGLVFLAGGVIPSHFFNADQLQLHLAEVYTSMGRVGLLENCMNAHMGGSALDGGPGEAMMHCLRAPAVLTLFWAMFLHGGWYHFLINGLTLLIFGPNVEAYMGRNRFLMFYFSCGVFGFFVQSLFYMDSNVPIIGASGAISGLFGAYMALFTSHHIRITLGNPYRPGGFYRDISIPVKALLVIYIVTQVFHEIVGRVTTAIVPGMENQNIAFLTHIGGFICGYFLANSKGGGLGRPRFTVFQGGAGKGPYTD